MAIHPSRFSGKNTTPRVVAKTKSKSKPPARGGWLFKFGLVGMVVVAGFLGWRLLQYLPNIPDQKTYPSGTNIQQRTNILLARLDGNQLSYVAVASLAKDDQPKLLELNPQVVTDLPLGQGSYQLAQTYSLGNQAGNRGVNLLRDGVSRLLAVPIDGFIAVDAQGWQEVKTNWGDSPDQIIKSLSSPFFSVRLLTYSNSGPIYGSLSYYELWQLSQQVGKNGTVKELSLSSVLLPDSRGAALDVNAFDDQIGSQFQESSITNVRPHVAVVNASGVVGVATEVARYVKNLGGNVITIETASQVVPMTSIKDHLNGSELTSRLSTLIYAPVSSDHLTSRADIEITIGQDAKKWF